MFSAARGHAATRIHVRGQAKIEMHAGRDTGDLVLSGALLDDTGQPLAKEAVSVTLARDGDPKQLVVFDEAHAARGCGSRLHEPQSMHATGPLTLTTDESGRFCFRITLPQERYVVQAAWAGASLVDAVKHDLFVDLARQALSLSFDPEPHIVSLDAQTSVVEAVAAIDENGVTQAGALLAIELTNERGELVANGLTNANGRLRLDMPTAKLGPPGKGELRLAFAGNVDTAKASYAADIERHARVTLRAPLVEVGGLAPAWPEDGIAIALLASWKNGPVPTGTIEARVGDIVVGAALVEGGASKVTVTFATQADAQIVPVRLRYSSSTPWFEAGDDLEIKVPVRGPSAWRQAPLVLAGLAVVGWLFLGRIRKKIPVAAPVQAKPQTKGEAKIDVVREAKSSKLGWSGRITDAHDGTPVAKARITILRPGFERAEVIASAYASDAGRFELRADTRTGDELAIEGSLHAPLKQAIPPCGELEIALVLRKRKLLERLVKWARLRGRPFDAHPEPTPGHVRRAAGNDSETARWAEAVERAAYAGGQVDARAEAEVERLAPPPPKPVAHLPNAAPAVQHLATVIDMPPVELDDGAPPDPPAPEQTNQKP